jgi:hypothetical protein
MEGLGLVYAQHAARLSSAPGMAVVPREQHPSSSVCAGKHVYAGRRSPEAVLWTSLVGTFRLESYRGEQHDRCDTVTHVRLNASPLADAMAHSKRSEKDRLAPGSRD